MLICREYISICFLLKALKSLRYGWDKNNHTYGNFVFLEIIKLSVNLSDGEVYFTRLFGNVYAKNFRRYVNLNCRICSFNMKIVEFFAGAHIFQKIIPEKVEHKMVSFANENRINLLFLLKHIIKFKMWTYCVQLKFSSALTHSVNT